MTAKAERLLVDLFEEVGIGAFRFRQPYIPVDKRGDGDSDGSYKQRYVSPKQPLDLFLMTTMKVPKKYIDKYDIKRYYSMGDGYYVDFRVGVEEKSTKQTRSEMSSKITKSRNSRFISYCLKKNLVPVYIITHVDGSIKNPSRDTCKFQSLYIDENFRKRSHIFAEDSKRFFRSGDEDDFITEFILGYFKHVRKWRDDFQVLEIED